MLKQYTQYPSGEHTQHKVPYKIVPKHDHCPQEENVVGETDIYTTSKRQNIKRIIQRSVEIVGAEEAEL